MTECSSNADKWLMVSTARWGELTGKNGVDDGDVAVKWCLSQGLAVATTIKSMGRLKGYLNAFEEFRLADEDTEDIREMGSAEEVFEFYADERRMEIQTDTVHACLDNFTGPVKE
ncbi:hypothetical protein ED733_002426 [Metarhizium rileyi]|uniref:NADP-dependent oxidoreductase domain-containing protein n=1 Tax=Metarhizium rileyi (strain RCEF 4871) TaxID=1649241 RepID=A0A5C6G7C7_METRR|nr:hypothetical protein ED733_002426 [Metarhizium rileyi]